MKLNPLVQLFAFNRSLCHARVPNKQRQRTEIEERRYIVVWHTRRKRTAAAATASGSSRNILQIKPKHHGNIWLDKIYHKVF